MSKQEPPGQVALDCIWRDAIKKESNARYATTMAAAEAIMARRQAEKQEIDRSMGKVFPRDWKYVPQDVRPFNIYNIEEGIYKPGMFNKK